MRNMATQMNVETILATEPARIDSALKAGVENSDIRELLDSFYADLTEAHQSEYLTITNSLSTMLAELTLAKNELMHIGPNAVSKKDIPDARDQLSAITDSTETAANTILDAAEKLSEMSVNDASPDKDILGDKSTTLFEASTFQDICGQRITKVLTMLNGLEAGMSRLAELIGDTKLVEDQKDANQANSGDQNSGDGNVLEGPQLEGTGNSQDDIDTLMASSD